MKQEAMSLDLAIREQAARTTSVLLEFIGFDPLTSKTKPIALGSRYHGSKTIAGGLLGLKVE